MAATCVAYDQCSTCGIDVPIAIRFHATTRASDGLTIEVEPDLTDVMAHTWTHEP